MDHDDDGMEGAIVRNLFRTDSDNSEEDDDSVVALNRLAKSPLAAQEEEDATTPSSITDVIQRAEIMHVLLESMQVGGSIAHRLWPAAEYLASFVLKIAQSDKESLAMTENAAGQQLHTLFNLLSNNSNDKPLSIIELGAGVGLTGLELASQLPVKLLLTDLNDGLPLLKKNVELNRDRFVLGADAVQVQKLEWGQEDDCRLALEWHEKADSSRNPLLIIGSDCVYWKNLHEPLEKTLYQLLSEAPSGSMCLLAGQRRWKRDNAFYQNLLGKQTRTATHELRCTCLQETVSRRNEDDDGRREIMRIYAIQWSKRQRRRRKQQER